MYFVIYRDKQNQWRWALFSSNNRQVADSSEGYHNKTDCQHGIDLVKASYNAPVYER
jgi:uncharacterized protein YegP (UPF0339 family)